MIRITEPVRKSILDVVRRNLRAAGCKMEGIIHELCMDYSDMPITGLFLVYPTCYVHVLEAWEDIIYKHYELMYATKNDECKFGKAIPLPSYHHVYQRFFTGWCHVYMIPPTLLEMLEDHTLAGIQKHVFNCLIKVYALCEYVSNTVREKSISVQHVLHQLEGPRAAQYLPESTVFEFLLNVKSPVIKTIQEHSLMYSDMSPSAFWDGKDYAYNNLFNLFIF
ncbi:uncharacterized protein LOC105280920 [Ooceraea biroi]|uniref:uncharacterized protein LOC105280920 n=1 Tax=Ooceraea biroi TaxID=2015173 RepID=UPI000F07AB33|nr:uncharacterized protein LOC105280920 [Ooceraea biroi]